MATSQTTDRSLTPLDRIAIVIATGGGVGFVPVIPGTLGSLLGVSVYLLVYGYGLDALYLPLLAALTPVAIWAASRAEKIYGKDASRIAVDEVVGQMLALGFVDRSGPALLTGSILGFLLFRFFDILKPFPIRHLERLPRSLGVVADDLGAGVYALVVLTGLEHLIGNFF